MTEYRTFVIIADIHDGVIKRELCTERHDHLLVAQLVTQTETTTYKSFVFIDKTKRILRRGSRIVLDTGGEEVGITDLTPETQTMCDVALVVCRCFGIGFIDRRNLLEVLRFLLGSRQRRLRFRSGFGRSRLRCSRLIRSLSLLGFRLLCLGFLTCFLLLRSGFRLLFFLLSSRFLTILGSFCFGFFAFLRLFCFLFLALRFGFGLGVHGVNSRDTVIYHGYHRSDGSHTHCHEEYVNDSFHALFI